MIGRTISHYRVLSKLGEGGMGVVYKAEDTKLERPVALKFLAAQAIEDPENRTRFLREAKAAARLDHPNICPVHEIDEADGQTFLVMAYLEGRTVKDKIAERPLKLDEALYIGIQIAEGLKAAHEKEVVHRDIKPANLMLTKGGQLKIMDFGLAQLAEASKLTKTQTLLGTPTYMSPEQARREPTDHRTDIWSLGVVIYEMVTGLSPFEGERQEAVLYAIEQKEPEPVTALRSGLPTDLDHILEKALAKNQDERYQHVEDMQVDLRWLQKKLASGRSTITQAGAAPGLAPPRAPDGLAKGAGFGSAPAHERFAWLFAVFCFVGMLALAWLYFRQTPSKPPLAPLLRFGFTPPVSLRAELGFHPNDGISPNGKHIVFTAQNESRLWIHDLERGTSRPLEGTEGADDPFWSPGSDFIGYFAGAQIRTIPARGGMPTRVYERPGSTNDFGGDVRFRGGAWRPDGNSIVFSEDGKLYEVPARGGTPQLLVSPEEPGQSSEPSKGATGLIRWPHFLPPEDGARVLVYTFGSESERTMMVHDLDSGRREVLGPGELPFYSPSGHLLYQAGPRTYDLWALPFSLGALQGTGPAFSITQNGRHPTVSADGTLTYIDVSSSEPQQLVWWDREGNKLGTIGEPHTGEIRHPSLSPDGRRVVVDAFENGNQDIWIHEVDRPVKTRLTTHEAVDFFATWSPKGDQIAFSSGRTGGFDIYVVRADGSEKPIPLVHPSVFTEYLTDWWADEGILVFTRLGMPKADQMILYLERKEKGEGYEEVLFLENGRMAKLSPDGRYMAYESDHSGPYETYIRSFPDGKGRLRVSVNGGRQVRWRRDGKELFYVEGDTLMATSVSTVATLTVGYPQRLFSSDQLRLGAQARFTYDVTADGQRFMLPDSLAESFSPMIRVVQNWYEEFRDRD